MATKKDVRVRIRINILTIGLQDKGDAEKRPSRQGSQKKIIQELPEFEISTDELDTRVEKALQVIQQGYWVDPDDIPPQVVTDDAASITATGVVLKGHVKSGTALIAATCGFQYGLTPALGTTVAATQSPVASATNTAISRTLAGLVTKTKYYYRAYATDVNFSGGKYGTLKSFTTL